jgi:hypothetical protein
MKAMIKCKVCFCVAIMALVSGCQVTVGPGSAEVEVGGPVVEVAPEAYVWDGVEYVGDYNGQYMYLNPGGVWVVCDPIVLERFHGWEGYHPDWRQEAIHNEGEHRLDRQHPPSARERVAMPENRAAAPEHTTAAPEEHRAVAPEHKTVAPVKKTTAPEKKTEEKRDDNK